MSTRSVETPGSQSPESSPDLFNRPPRVLLVSPTDEVEIPGPPQAVQPRGSTRLIGIAIPLISSLVYLSVAAARGNLLSSLPIVLIAGISAYVGYDAYRRQRRDHEAAVAAYKSTYQDALERTRKRLEILDRQQRACYEENNPDLPQLLQIAAGERNRAGDSVPAARLWERRPNDPDFLALRVGRGDRPTNLSLKLPSLNAYAADGSESLQLAAQYQVLRNVPVAIDLRTLGAIGIAGPSGRAMNLLQALLWQVAVHHSPSEVRIAALWDAQFDESWGWLRWLPHTRTLDGDENYRLLARYDRSPEALHKVLGAISKEIKRRAEDDQPSGSRPHLVVVLSEYHAHRDKSALFAQCIAAKHLDVSTICLVPEVRDVPSECGGYIDLNHGGSASHTRMGVAGTSGGYTVFTADLANTADSTVLAQRLAPIELANVDGGREMPRNVQLLSLLGISDAASYTPQTLWDKALTDSWHPVPVGRRNADELLEINLNEGTHGVHGMIAGATGAGKSELLLSFLMALAIKHHPHRLNFLLIDFKGGATFRDIDELPHTAGMVTDLSGFLAERALIAMNSELDRRKRLLATNNVPNIRAYRKSGLDQHGAPLPNLLIAIDEFDEMIRDYPQFQDELIRVGKQGRSLGVHLLFATQQPSLIKEGLLNNLSYWMSLRVNSRDDSRAMVGVPDAALLGTDTPGRGFFRDKNSGVRMFQSALITALYRPSAGSSRREVDVTGRVLENTGETRAHQMLQGRLDNLNEKLKIIQTQAQRTQLIEQESEQMGTQLMGIFEWAPTVKPAGAIRQTISDEIRRLLQTIIDLPALSGADAVAEAIEQQIAAAAGAIISRLLGDREQISEIRLIARQMVATQGARYAAKKFPIWEEPLPSMLPLVSLVSRSATPSGWLDVPYGLIDQPEAACHAPLRTDLAGAGGNLLAVGTSGSGKTTLLLTLILALADTHSPSDLWFYIIDGAGTGLGLRDTLPHIADTIVSRQHVLIERLLVELQDQIEVRRTLFAQYGVTSLLQFRSARARQTEQMPSAPPALVVVIDNLVDLIGQSEQAVDTLKSLMREGRAYGIFFLVSAYGLREAANLANSFETRLALHVNSDDDSHALIGKDYASRLIRPDQPGRAFLRGSPRPVEAQIALPAIRARTVDASAPVREGDTEVAYSDITQEVNRSTDEIRKRWLGAATVDPAGMPRRLQMLPTVVELPALLAATPQVAPPACEIPLGTDGASLQPLIWSLDRTAHLLVTGGPRTGKSTLLRSAAAALAERYPESVELVLVDYSLRTLRDIERLRAVRRFTDLPVGTAKELRDVTVIGDKDELAAVLQVLKTDLDGRLRDLRKGLSVARRTVLVIDSWDLVVQDYPTTVQIDSFVRRGGDIGMHCLIAYTDPSVGSSHAMLKAARSNYVEIVMGRPAFDSAPYTTAINRRFKSALVGELPLGRAFVLETGQTRMAQIARADADMITRLSVAATPNLVPAQPDHQPTGEP